MTKSKLIIFFVLIILIFGCQSKPAQDQVCLKNKCVNVEVAQTPEDVSVGLMYRKSLPQDAGMLFIFADNDYHGFWMKNTLIPLDIIWMDYARRVVHIERNVPPCKRDPCPSYGPAQSTMYVLEINANHADNMGFQVGDQLDFRLINLE